MKNLSDIDQINYDKYNMVFKIITSDGELILVDKIDFKKLIERLK